MTNHAAAAAATDAACRRPITDLLPHREPMVLLDEALGIDGEWFRARVRVRESSPFLVDGAVPAWVGLEYMAQAVAAYSGALGLARGGVPKVGMLLGTREYRAEVPAFPLGSDLEVRVRIDLFQENGVSSLDCRILAADGSPLARAQVTVIEPGDIRDILKGGSA